MKINEIQNIIEPQDYSKPYVIMVYNNNDIKPLFNKAITCSSKQTAKDWLKSNGYKKKKDMGYYVNVKKNRIANMLPTKYYR